MDIDLGSRKILLTPSEFSITVSALNDQQRNWTRARHEHEDRAGNMQLTDSERKISAQIGQYCRSRAEDINRLLNKMHTSGFENEAEEVDMSSITIRDEAC